MANNGLVFYLPMRKHRLKKKKTDAFELEISSEWVGCIFQVMVDFEEKQAVLCCVCIFLGLLVHSLL